MCSWPFRASFWPSPSSRRSGRVLTTPSSPSRSPLCRRLARAETLTIRKSDYIAAVQLQRASSLRIIFGHVMPMCVSSVVVRVTLNMASIILTAAGLGFLGLGAQPPSPEWGAMLASAREFVLTSGTLAAIPGTAILVVSLAFNLLGDGLRDMLDPRHG